jgi:hypothetical protein
MQILWNVTSEYPPKLINTTENATPRVTIESANTNHCEATINPKEFMADTMPPVITDMPVIKRWLSGLIISRFVQNRSHIVIAQVIPVLIRICDRKRPS